MRTLTNTINIEQRKDSTYPIAKLEAYSFDYPAKQAFSHTMFDWVDVYEHEDVDKLGHAACISYDGTIMRWRVQQDEDDKYRVYWQRITDPDLESAWSTWELFEGVFNDPYYEPRSDNATVNVCAAASPVDGEVYVIVGIADKDGATSDWAKKSTDNGETWLDWLDFGSLMLNASGNFNPTYGSMHFNEDGDIGVVGGNSYGITFAHRMNGQWVEASDKDLVTGDVRWSDCVWDADSQKWWVAFMYDASISGTYYITTITYDPYHAEDETGWGDDWTVNVLSTADHNTTWADIEPLKFSNQFNKEMEAHRLAYFSDRWKDGSGGFVSNEPGRLGLQQQALFDINYYWGARYNKTKGTPAQASTAMGAGGVMSLGGGLPMVGGNQLGAGGCGRNFGTMTASWYALGGQSGYWSSIYDGMYGISSARSTAGLVAKTQAEYYTTQHGVALEKLDTVGIILSIYVPNDILIYIYKPASGWEPATFDKAYRLNMAASRGIKFMYNTGRTDEYLWASHPDFVIRCKMPQWWEVPTAGTGIGETALEIGTDVMTIEETVNTRESVCVVTLDNSTHVYDDAGTGDYANLSKGNIVYVYLGFNVDGTEHWHNFARYIIGDVSFERAPGFAFCTMNLVDGWHLSQKVIISRPYNWNEFTDDYTALELLEFFIEAIGGTLNVVSNSDLINTMYPRFSGSSGSTVAELINRILGMCAEDKIYWYGLDAYLVNPQTTDESVYSYTFPAFYPTGG